MGPSRPADKQAFRARLRAWFRRHRRDLPWRNTRDPYAIWVSEVMLQQTRAAAVIPYYLRFLSRFPDVVSLARSDDAELLECWSGLGYYSRARNLRLAAQSIVANRSNLPVTFEQWAELPGVGPYTAAAVSSIAFNAPVAVLDGNVARVLARLTNHAGDVRFPRTREELRRRAQALLDRRYPGDFNQAMMELGATLCLPKNPQCLICPIAKWCEARRLGIQNELPVRLGPKPAVRLRIAVALVERQGRILFEQRPENETLMPGFWQLPQIQLRQAKAGRLDAQCFVDFGIDRNSALGEFRHSITHYRYVVTVFLGRLRGRRPPRSRWIAAAELGNLPLTTITKKALRVWTRRPPTHKL